MELNEKAIVLGKRKYSEADLIVHCISENGERLNLLARSALKSRKRFGGGILDPTHFIKVSYKPADPNRNNALGVLNEASLIRDFIGIRADYDRLEMALYFLDLVSKVCKEGSLQTTELFSLLGHSLASVEKSQKLELLRVQFETKLLYQQGVLPPELPVKNLLKYSVADHEALSMSLTTLQSVKSKVAYVLDSYLE